MQTVRIREYAGNMHVALIGDDRVDLYYDDVVDDWIVVHRTGSGIGQPGGITDRSNAITYGLYLLGVIEKPEGIRPVERC